MLFVWIFIRQTNHSGRRIEDVDIHALTLKRLNRLPFEFPLQKGEKLRRPSRRYDDATISGAAFTSSLPNCPHHMNFHKMQPHHTLNTRVKRNVGNWVFGSMADFRAKFCTTSSPNHLASFIRYTSSSSSLEMSRFSKDQDGVNMM